MSSHERPKIPALALPNVIGKREHSPRYAGVEEVEYTRIRFDLSAGESPFGPPPAYVEIRRRLEESGAFVEEGSHYKEVDTAKAAQHVRDRFSIPGAELDEDTDVIFSSQGSYGILREIPGMFSPNSKVQVWGIGPHFPSLDVFLMSQRQEGAIQGRMTYAPVQLDLSRPTQEVMQKAIEVAETTAKRRDNVVWYFCNPGTPMGDIIPSDVTHEFIEKVTERGHLVIADEAFGDSMDDRDSVIPLTKSNAKLIVLKSLGKLLGMPGERLGYAVMHRNLGEIYRSNQLVYDMPGPSQLVANEILDPAIINPFLEEVRGKTVQVKSRLIEELRKKKITILPTALQVPILAVDGEGSRFSLELRKRGIKAVEGSGFYKTHPDMTNRYVRIRIPNRTDDSAEIARIISNARNASVLV